MPKTGGNSRNQRNNPYQLDELFIKFHRTPAGIAWRWRTELLTLSGLAAAWWRLDTWTSAIWAAVIIAAFAVVVLAVPHSRRFITRRFWCVLARHRLQRLCYEARLHTRNGRLPLILWTRPTKVGERTWVLCRAGICAEDFEAHIGELRAYFSATVGTKPQRETFAGLSRDLVARGRAAGVILALATQRPSHQVIDPSMRDLFGYRWAFRCTTDSSSDVVLGQGWAAEGYTAADIDPLARGVGWLLSETGIPRRIKAAYLDDDTIKYLAAYAARLRHGAAA